MKGYTGTITGGTLVVALISLSVALSDYSALAYQGRLETQANAALEHSHSAFMAQVSRSLADGTPDAALAQVASAERQLYASVSARPAAFVDRTWVAGVQQRATRIETYTQEVVTVEAQVEMDLQQRVHAVLVSLQAGIQPARDAGIDTSAYDAYLALAMQAVQDVQVPAKETQALQAAQAEAAQLAQVTSDQVAANQAAAVALANAKSDAQGQLGRFQRDLANVQAVPVLDAGVWVQSLPQLTAQVAKAQALDDFRNAAAAVGAQADAMEDLLYTRNLAFQLLSEAQGSLAAAQGQKLSVDGDAAGLATAATQLPLATNLGTILNVKASILAIKNDLDFQVQEAQVRNAAGKLILVSLGRQHLTALQDGVVQYETDITTGRPALPTPPGAYHVMAKYSPYEMVSPWPPGSPYYYYPSWVKMAMLFRDGGYFIHDAPWRTDYGPGSNLRGGTHGCVNVPLAGEQWLWNWAPVGTSVVVEN